MNKLGIKQEFKKIETLNIDNLKMISDNDRENLLKAYDIFTVNISKITKHSETCTIENRKLFLLLLNFNKENYSEYLKQSFYEFFSNKRKKIYNDLFLCNKLDDVDDQKNSYLIENILIEPLENETSKIINELLSLHLDDYRSITDKNLIKLMDKIKFLFVISSEVVNYYSNLIENIDLSNQVVDTSDLDKRNNFFSLVKNLTFNILISIDPVI